MTANIAGILLAAGMSQRLGTPKQLLRIDGEYLLARTAAAAVDSNLVRIYLVVGHALDRIKRLQPHLFSHPKIEVVCNPDYRKGLGTSLRAGLSSAHKRHAALMFLMADQPFMHTALIDRLLAAFAAAAKGICLPQVNHRRRNPVVFDRRYFDSLMNSKGDVGGRRLIQRHPHDVHAVAIGNEKDFFDIDTPRDVERLQRDYRLQIDIQY